MTTGTKEFGKPQGARTRTLAFLTVALCFAGCAASDEVVKLIDDPAGPQVTYKRLLVINVSSDRDQQVQFENEIVGRLRRSDVVAIPGHLHLDASDGLPRAEIDRIGDELVVDGILITHIAGIATDIESAEGREEIRLDCRRGNPIDYFLYDSTVLKEPDSVKIAHTMTVISNLYDRVGKKRVWSIQSTCFAKSSIATVLHDEARIIVRQLQADDFI